MIITTVKKTIKAVIIVVLLLPFYVIPSQQSIKKGSINEIINGFFVPRKWFALDPIKQ